MGYFQLEENAPGAFHHPAVQGTNSAEDALDFDEWIWNGIKEAIRIGKESCTGATQKEISR